MPIASKSVIALCTSNPSGASPVSSLGWAGRMLVQTCFLQGLLLRMTHQFLAKGARRQPTGGSKEHALFVLLGLAFLIEDRASGGLGLSGVIGGIWVLVLRFTRC